MNLNGNPRSLGAQVSRSILIVLIVAGILQLAFFWSSIHRQFTLLENEDTSGDYRRITAALQAEEESLVGFSRDYASWDDARDFIAGWKPEFPEENFAPPEWAKVNAIEQAMILSASGTILWNGYTSPDGFVIVGGGGTEEADLLSGHAREWLTGAGLETPAVRFARTGTGIILQCGYPVTSNDYSSPATGWIFFARRVDDSMLQRISDRSGLTSVLMRDSDRPAGGPLLALGETGARYFDTEHERYLLLPIFNSEGEEIAVIETVKSRVLESPARYLLLELALSLALTAACTVLILILRMRRLAVNPLVRMAHHLSRRTDNWDAGTKLEMGAGAGRLDEIGVVSDRIDSLLDRLEAERLELEQLNEELAQMAKVDHLTGLANRRSFDEYAVKEVKRLMRESRENGKPGCVAILIADIDHFKMYNDRYGHQAGDACLREVAEAIARSVHRPADLPCRFGGEEFIVLLPETDRAGAAIVAENMRAAVAGLALPNLDSPVLPVVTMSVGLAADTVAEAFDLEALIKRADQAMYAAKRAGRNKVMSAE